MVRLLLPCAIGLLASTAYAQESVQYQYDALGRLITSATTGSYNNGAQTQTQFDPAGNRTGYTVSGVGGTNIGSLSIADVSSNEGTALQFNVTRSGNTSNAASVSYSTSDGSAHSGVNYTGSSGTIAFSIGEASKTITIPTMADGVANATLTMSITLSNPQGVSLAGGSATGSIINTDPAPSFAVGTPPAVTEGSSVTFTITKTGNAGQAYAVNYATADGSAIAGQRYNAASGTLTFAPSETTKNVAVSTINTSSYEGSQTFSLQLSGATLGATIATSQATATINDDDAAPTFSVGNASAVTEGGVLSFTVSKSGSTSLSHSVSYATANGSAVAGQRYNATSGVLTFAPGETSKVVSVSTIANTSNDGNQTVLLNISGATGGAGIATAQGSGTINEFPAPVTAVDSLNLNKCSTASVNVVSNDTDPGGHTPLTVIAATHSNASRGYISSFTSTNINYTSYNSSGGDTVTYTVRNSVGITSTGTVSVNVRATGPVCGE